MQEILVNKLHEYIRANNPELLLALEQENKVTEYLQESVSTADDLINQLLRDNKPASLVEEFCIDELTKQLRPSRFNYIKSVLEEEFSGDFERLSKHGVLTTEVLNLMSVCDPMFEELGFSEQTEDNRHLRYAVMGAIHEYLDME
ncbi:MAG: DUF1896 family protein [Chitinophagaceae bacterium]